MVYTTHKKTLQKPLSVRAAQIKHSHVYNAQLTPSYCKFEYTNKRTDRERPPEKKKTITCHAQATHRTTTITAPPNTRRDSPPLIQW